MTGARVPAGRGQRGRSSPGRPRLAGPAGPVAWRLDLGEDSFALLECPVPRGVEALRQRLTPAQAEVARLMAAGLSNAEIARSRGTSPRTVANQAASIFRRLGVTSRLGLDAWMARGGPRPEEEPR